MQSNQMPVGTELPPPSPSSQSIPIFRRSDVVDQLRPLCDDSLELDEDWAIARPDDAISNEDRRRYKALKSLLDDPAGGRRRLIIGDDRMAAKLGAMRSEAPNFTKFIDVVERAVALSQATCTPLDLPPILLVGESEIGKTRLLRQLSGALATTATFVDMPGTDAFKWRGLSAAWRGARAGKVAEALLGCPTAQPAIFLDEFEKPAVIDRTAERPHDLFHALLEEETAGAHLDDYLEIAFDCRHVLWFASANSLDGIPRSVLSRFHVLMIPSPSRSQREVMLENIFIEANDRYGKFFDEPLDEGARRELSCYGLREAKRVLRLAMGCAASMGTKVLTREHVQEASRLSFVPPPSSFRFPAGFCPSRSL